MSTLAEVEDGIDVLVSRYVVADRLDCNPDTVSEMAKDGRFIPPIMVGNMMRWRARDVNEWIAERAASKKKIAAAAAKSLQPVKRARRRA